MFADALLAVWFAFVFISEPIERASHHRIVTASNAVTGGMTPGEVEAILGDPAAEYSKRSVIATWWLGAPRPKQWMYGTGLNLGYVVRPGVPFLNPFAFNIRIFDYADIDLVIDWTPQDRVLRVNRPVFDVPDVAFEMLDAVQFVGTVARSIVLARRQPVGG